MLDQYSTNIEISRHPLVCRNLSTNSECKPIDWFPPESNIGLKFVRSDRLHT